MASAWLQKEDAAAAPEARHYYRSFSGDVPYRSPGTVLSPEQHNPISHREDFGRTGYGRQLQVRDSARIEGSKLLKAALAGNIDIGKFVQEEAARAREAIRKQSGPSRAPSGYTMRTTEGGELSPRAAFGVPPLQSESCAVTTEVPKKLLRHHLWKDRIAGGGSLPLADTEQQRRQAHFLECFSLGEIEAVHKLMEKDGLSIETCDGGGSTGLHYAARSGNFKGLKLAFELGLSLDSANNGGYRAIHFAAQQAASVNKLTESLQWLVMQGTELDATTNSGMTAAQLARELGKSEMVAEWLELHKSTPKWIASKETVANGGPRRIFEPPCTTGSVFSATPIHD